MDTFKELLENNLLPLFDRFYQWSEGWLEKAFSNLDYQPLKQLLTNPWFWIILIIIIILGLVFRRR
jgi:hypothetical protein